MRFTSHINAASTVTVVPRIRICVTLITAPATLIGSVGSSSGKGLGLGFQMIIANVCNSRLTPIAVINGASRGALRNGR